MSSNPCPLTLRGVATLAVLCLVLPSMLAAQRPSGVSPGSATTAVRLAGSCPTFAWSGVAGAAGYELAIYRLRADGSLETALSKRIIGDARAWAPAADECPQSGQQYAWAVRALGEKDAGAWSELMLFETAGTPSDNEVRQAIEVLQRYRGSLESSGRAPGGTTAAPATIDSSLVPPGTAPASPAETAVESTPSPRVVTTPGSFALNVDRDFQLGGDVFRGSDPFIHTDPVGTGNLAVGVNALVSSTSGVGRNSAFGYRALQYSDPGYENTALGFEALRQNTGGSRNTAVGSMALLSNTTGAFNTAVGSGALRLTQSGSSNTALGYAALGLNTGDNNTALGRSALTLNETGFNNVAVGHLALFDNADGDRNVAIGTQSLSNNTDGYYNTAVGEVALFTNTSGAYNTALGGNALRQNTVGGHNVAVGRNALSANVDGEYNTAIGSGAGSSLQDGDNNVMLGRGAIGSQYETHTIRIGGYNFQYDTYIEGIYGATATGGIPVLINSSNQLGTMTSSARFKQEIRDVQGTSR